MNQFGPPPQPRFWLLGTIMIIAMAMTALVASRYFVGRQTLVVTVLSADLPRTCYKAKKVLFGKSRYRSSTPKSGEWEYCGLVVTDHGSVALPQSSTWGWESGREQLFDVLCEGALFKISVTGYGTELEPGGRTSNNSKELLSAERLEECLPATRS